MTFLKRNLFLILIFFLCVVIAKAKENKEYRFNWYPVIDIGDNIINFPDSSKYETYNSSGVWEDNYGNYGMMEQSSFVMLDNNDVIELDGYGKRIYQNNQETYFRGYRNRQEKDSGVGETKIVNASEELSSLIGMRCPYAVNFFNDTAYAFAKCKITEEQKKILSEISQ